MKYVALALGFLVFFISVVLATGCSAKKTNKQVEQEQRFEPKFAYKQEVVIQHGFLKGQAGVILSAEKCVDDGQGTYATDGVCYTIKLNGEDGKTWLNVPERELEL